MSKAFSFLTFLMLSCFSGFALAQPAMVGQTIPLLPGQSTQLSFDYLGTGSTVIAGQFDIDVSSDQLEIAAITCTAPFICNFQGTLPFTIAFLDIGAQEVQDAENVMVIDLQAAPSVTPGADLQVQIFNELYFDANSLPIAINGTQNGIVELPIYFETFFNGLPADWPNIDASGNNALWTWCSDPANGQINGCPALWDDPDNQQTTYSATTSESGFVTLDSSFYGPLPTNHISELTTAPIDLSQLPRVSVRFENHLGVNTLDAENNAMLRVSNNGGMDWQDFVVFPGLVTGDTNPPLSRWSFNPQITEIDISSVAAGQPSVLLQWRWQGNNEFHWNLDDIAITVPPPPENIFSDGFEL